MDIKIIKEVDDTFTIKGLNRRYLLRLMVILDHDLKGKIEQSDEDREFIRAICEGA